MEKQKESVDTDTFIALVTRVRQLQKEGKKDKEIGEIVSEEFAKYCLTFSVMSLVDDVLLMQPDPQRAFWRAAYKYPKEGDILENGAVAVNVGLFTFDQEETTCGYSFPREELKKFFGSDSE